jgi:hypothetical protein
MVKRSIEFLIPHSQLKPKIDIQFFSKKKQFKAFVEIQDASVAKQFFTKTFSAKNLALLDNNLNVVMSREMRSYLVKTEEQFTLLAMQRYQEEIKAPSTKTAEEKKRKPKLNQGNRSEAIQIVNRKLDMLSLPTQISSLGRSERNTSSIDSGFLASAGSSSKAEDQSVSSEFQNATIFSHSTPGVPKMNYDLEEGRHADSLAKNEELKSFKPSNLKFNKRFKENSSESKIAVENLDKTPRFSK